MKKLTTKQVEDLIKGRENQLKLIKKKEINIDKEVKK